MVSNAKILWGFVEKSSIRQSGYRVVLETDSDSLETLTNSNGFYQINLGNLHSPFADGDLVTVYSIGDISYYGESAVVLAGGTATQQVPTIDVSNDLVAPIFTVLTPTPFSTEAFADVVIRADDLHSGIDRSTLNVSIDGNPVIENGTLTDLSYNLVFAIDTLHVLAIVLVPPTPMSDGSVRSVDVSVADKVGNEANSSFSFIVDLSLPDIVVVSPPVGSFTSNGYQPIEWSIEDVVSGIDVPAISIEVNGDSYTSSSPEVQINGNNIVFTPVFQYSNLAITTWTIEVRDLAGNTNSLTGYFAVSLDRPRILEATPGPNAYTDDRQTNLLITLESNSAPIVAASIVLTINSTTYTISDPEVLFSQNVITFTPPIDWGLINYVHLELEDQLGQQLDEAWSFGLDELPPSVEVVVPDGSYVRSALSALHFRLEDDLSGIDASSIELIVNGVAYTSSSPELAYSNGSLIYVPSVAFDNIGNSAVFMVSDLAGNAIVPLFLIFDVDADGPVLASVTPIPGSTTNNLSQGIVMEIVDNLSGVDFSTLVVTLNGRQFRPGDSNLTIIGNEVTLLPLMPFSPSVTAIVELFIKDNVGNKTEIIATSFSFDLTALDVVDADPNSGTYTSIPPTQIKVVFNKFLNSDSIDASSAYIEARPMDDSSPWQVISADLTVNQSHLMAAFNFENGFKYRLSLTDLVADQAGNFLRTPGVPSGAVVYTSDLFVYIPGDTNGDNELSLIDIVHYQKIVAGCYGAIVASVQSISDLNGDGELTQEDVNLLQAIVLGEESAESISVGAEFPIVSAPPGPVVGSIDNMDVVIPPNGNIGQYVTATISLQDAQNIIGIQFDLNFDSNVLKLINASSLREDTEIFAFHGENGTERFIIADFDLMLFADFLSITFLVVGPGSTSVSIQDVEAIDTNENIISPTTVTDGTFLALPVSDIATILVDPDERLVPTSVREVGVMATLKDINGANVQVVGMPMTWEVVGNGFILGDEETSTVPNGFSRNSVRLTGVAGNEVRVKVSLLNFPSIFGLSPTIQLYDFAVSQLILEAPQYEVSTGEPLQFTAYVLLTNGLKIKTTDINWQVSSTDAIISSTGEFVAFQEGTFRVTASLNSDPDVIAISSVITAFHSIQLLDCNGNRLSYNPATGFSQIDLGEVFAGDTTGTQEIRIVNVSRSRTYSTREEILLDLSTSPFTTNLQLEFFPVVEGSLLLERQLLVGKRQIIPLADGHTDFIFQKLLLSQTDVDGILKIRIPHVNLTEAYVINCPPKSCPPSLDAFLVEKDSLAEVVDIGDFYVDKLDGHLYVKIERDHPSPGKLCYSYETAATVDLDTGQITLLEPVATNNDRIVASYKFKSGILENVEIEVPSEYRDVLSLSLDGITFYRQVLFDLLLPGENKPIYIKAETSPDNGSVNVFASISVHATLVTVQA